ncbi:MAG: 2-amino-4-hydroxy-6-hydroxymethyldihydropteridine diphosphokinase [Eubacterium sp.]|jgi:dihydroneopterin aldolase/2-amino-4-hydroxy-6-hydroxymethyldihydropteridine pyrophosphokinase|nr:2-amino-4-hydroxy-6-hydroxymethyldihydropteridine diphosphokinase [Eubacterium sp.]
MDQIIIQDLSIYAKHGVYMEENILGQQFLVSVYMDLDLSRAGQTDSLEHTLDYGKICHFVTKYMQSHTFKLIEAAAEHLAQELLLTYDPIKKIRIKVKKPWAPIGLPIKNVCVSVDRTRHSVYLSLGSNMGDRQAYLDQGIKEVDALDSCKVCERSAVIETEPYGDVVQERFLNCVIRVETVLNPQQLLEKLHEIEARADRKREVHWGPRTLDLDILFYDHVTVNSPNLTIPHADLHNRSFVLEPLCEIAPWYQHPVLHKTVRQLYDGLAKDDAWL